MGKIKYYIAKINWIIHKRNHEIMNEYFRKCGITVGHDTHIFSDISGGEGYLIKVGNNVTISNNVSLVTHDSSVEHYLDNATDVFGDIIIGNNVFIGINSTILPGVSIADDCVIGAGSVIAKSIEETGTVWAGNPARRITTVKQLAIKNEPYAVDLRLAKNPRMTIENCKKIKK